MEQPGPELAPLWDAGLISRNLAYCTIVLTLKRIFFLKKIIYLGERAKALAGLLLKCLVWLVDPGHGNLNAGVPKGWQEPHCLTHPCCLPGCIFSRSLRSGEELRLEPKYSNMQCKHLNLRLNCHTKHHFLILSFNSIFPLTLELFFSLIPGLSQKCTDSLVG